MEALSCLSSKSSSFLWKQIPKFCTDHSSRLHLSFLWYFSQYLVPLTHISHSLSLYTHCYNSLPTHVPIHCSVYLCTHPLLFSQYQVTHPHTHISLSLSLYTHYYISLPTHVPIHCSLSIYVPIHCSFFYVPTSFSLSRHVSTVYFTLFVPTNCSLYRYVLLSMYSHITLSLFHSMAIRTNLSCQMCTYMSTKHVGTQTQSFT